LRGREAPEAIRGVLIALFRSLELLLGPTPQNHDHQSEFMTRQYYVYIMANPRKTVLYTGVTNDLVRRVWQHRSGKFGGFAARYHCFKLVLYEIFLDSYNAIAREKQIKAGSRRRKVQLVERVNPEWRDLFEEL
jgi:putative endonuclease